MSGPDKTVVDLDQHEQLALLLTRPMIAVPTKKNPAVIKFVEFLRLWQVRDFNAVMKLSQPSWRKFGQSWEQKRVRVIQGLGLYVLHGAGNIKSKAKGKNMWHCFCDVELSMYPDGGNIARQMHVNIVREDGEWYFNPTSIQLREFKSK